MGKLPDWLVGGHAALPFTAPFNPIDTQQTHSLHSPSAAASRRGNGREKRNLKSAAEWNGAE